MKLFQMNEKNSVISPILMNKAFEAIQKEDVPAECEESHQELVESFTRVPIDQLNFQVANIAKENEAFGTALNDIMMTLRPSLPKIEKQIIIPHYLDGFEAIFGHSKTFITAKEALLKKDFRLSSQFIRKLFGEIAGMGPQQKKLCEMYSIIIKAEPDFQMGLSEDQVFYSIAPIQLKNSVNELFQELNKPAYVETKNRSEDEEIKEGFQSMDGQDAQSSWIITEKNEEIFYEDPSFHELLIWYLTELSDLAQIFRPFNRKFKSLKDLQQEHLSKALSQIETKKMAPQNKIDDFMAIDIDMDLQKLQTSIVKWYHEGKKLNGQSTRLVLYDLIKKKCSFENFIALLSQEDVRKEDMMFTQQFFLSYLLNNSDTYLRTMIFMACSFFMPLSLVSYQPVSQKHIPMQNYYHGGINSRDSKQESLEDYQQNSLTSQTKIEFLPYVYEELFYCFEKHMSVLAFKVSANPNKSPQGCTSLTNLVFNRTFSTHSKSLVNYGSIEIQFDYNFEKPIFVPVADAHGLVEDKILELAYPMFKIFMIHSFFGPQHQDILEKQIKKINDAVKDPLIFVIIHVEGRKQNDFTVQQVGKNVMKITLSRYFDLYEIQQANLRKTILKQFFSFIGDFEAYEHNFTARLKSHQEFSEFASRFQKQSDQVMQLEERQWNNYQKEQQDSSQLLKAFEIIQNFLRLINENKQQLRSKEVLTMNFLYEEACSLEKQMIRDSSLNEINCEKHRVKIAELYEEMKKSRPSPLTQEVKKIIDHQNYLGLTYIISKVIRSFLYFHFKPLQEERELLRTKSQQLEIEANEKVNMFNQIIDITKKLEKSWYSNEFLYREYYIYEKSKRRDSSINHASQFPDYLSLVNLQVSQGQPFEIIDGNNLQFINQVYQNILNDTIKNQEILVVSIIGPQSSGKSLLLNTLFGAQFQSSTGRCTRGIYGCLIDITCDIKQTRFKKMLILDTEGIQSTEALDEGFDKRVVFYILCVSHVVLICNKGEINKTMEDTIKLATDCMLQVREEIGQPPQVNIIMNNVQINEGALYQTIQSLQNSIMAMKRYEKLRQIFTIDQSNVFLLPNAFAQSGNEQFVAFKPSDQFALRVDLLRQRILAFMQNSTKESSASYTLSNWFEFAQKFWKFTNLYTGLTQYSTIEEKNEDIELLKFTKNLIERHFEEPEIKKLHEKQIIEEVKKVLGQLKAFDQTPIDEIQKDIEAALIPRNKEIESNIKKEYSIFISEQGIRPQLMKKRSDHLDTQIRQHILNWKQIAVRLLQEFIQNRSKFIANKSLQNAIDRQFLAKPIKFTFEEALNLFNREWDEIEKELKKHLKSIEQISEEIFQNMKTLYRSNVQGSENNQQERSLLSQYQSKGAKIISDRLSNHKKTFFYQNSQKIKPSIQKFKELIGKQKFFLKNDKTYFEESTQQLFFNWKKVIQERFNFFAYELKLIEACGCALNAKTKDEKRKKMQQKQVMEIIQQIRNEGAHFDVDITEHFEAFLTNLEKITIKNMIKEQKISMNGYIPHVSQKALVEEQIQSYVKNIKKNIELYFKHGNQRNNGPMQMRYFANESILSFDSSYTKKQDKFFRSKYQQVMERKEASYITGISSVDNQKEKCLTAKNQLNQDFYLYLQSLIKPDSVAIHNNSIQLASAVSTFFEQLEHDQILISLQNTVLVNIYRNSQGEHKTVEALVQELISADDVSITMNFCAMDYKQIQRIVDGVESVVAKINEDMEPYCLQVSEAGICCLHQITQTYIVRIMQEVIRLTDHAPLLTFKKTKDIQRDLFIAKLTSNDQEMDTKSAQISGRHLIQYIIDQQKAEQIEFFKNTIEGEKNLFKLKTIIQDIEKQVLQIFDGDLENPFDLEAYNKDGLSLLGSLKQMLLGMKEEETPDEEEKEEFKQKIRRLSIRDKRLKFTPEEIIMFYVLPSQFLKKRFKEQWKKITETQIKIAKDKYAQKIKEISLTVTAYFRNLKISFKTKKIQLATSAFIPPEGGDLSTQDVAFKIQCQKAMAIYLGLLLTNKWDQHSNSLIIDERVKMIAIGNLLTPNEIGMNLEEAYADQLQRSVQDQQISNIDNFIDSLEKEINTGLEIEIQSQNSLHENELIGNLKQEMKNKSLGCQKMCPLCRRQCDQVHDGDSQDTRIHKCDSGHQIQGFGGNRQINTNKAITYGCHELHDLDIVVWENEGMRWKIFKDKYLTERNWDIQDQDLAAMELFRTNNIKIWNLIGPFVCEYYRLEKKIDIQFQEADMSSRSMTFVKDTLYVLMLDNSSSMSSRDSNSKNGQSRWENLKNAVSQFIASIQNNVSIKNYSKISIITYNSTATLMKEAQIPSQDIVKELQDPNGGTDFDPPLIMAKDLMDRHCDSYESFVLAMMSDGESEYPSKGVESIKKSKVKSKLIFKSIAYGGGRQQMTKIAHDLEGECDNIINSNQLSDSFISMIPNMLAPK